MSYKDVNKQTIANWWSRHPQDYSGWEAPHRSDQETLVQYLARADAALRLEHGDLHDGPRLFGRLIPYSQIVGAPVLEVGCGLGAVSEALARAGAEVIALDLSEFGVVATETRMRINRLRGRAIRADAEALPFKESSFSFIWSWGVLHHTPDTEQAISEMHRALMPEGRCCVMLYHRHGLYAYINILLRYGLFQLQLLKYSLEGLLTRYSDGKQHGGSPLARYLSKKQAYRMFGAFSKVSISTRGYRDGILRVFPVSLGLRALADRLISDRAIESIMKRYGHFIIIQAVK